VQISRNASSLKPARQADSRIIFAY
jgi:hypothetical protein